MSPYLWFSWGNLSGFCLIHGLALGDLFFNSLNWFKGMQTIKFIFLCILNYFISNKSWNTWPVWNVKVEHCLKWCWALHFCCSKNIFCANMRIASLSLPATGCMVSTAGWTFLPAAAYTLDFGILWTEMETYIVVHFENTFYCVICTICYCDKYFVWKVDS